MPLLDEPAAAVLRRTAVAWRLALPRRAAAHSKVAPDTAVNASIGSRNADGASRRRQLGRTGASAAGAPAVGGP